ncbi:hypothetical protein SAMN05428642_101827 [Flaviramulus basaltis]|uniref:Uncharacterized protein n=1 Tax=Flaviramulus basaltis TaxID=369401 RepID=A0A1K2ICU0_9FLAO|nr:hypothetical protein [Flaviramulus basaltis]SFZ90252.1 hypothetical protein SAMN05428642_101827 [Flaviramulus basaltis]
MTNKIRFLEEFINCFLETGTKRRNFQNTIGNITSQINKISRKQFDKKLIFSEEEVIKAFSINGYEIMNNFGCEFDWDKFRNGTILPETNFINVKTPKLKRLISATYKSAKSNWNPETIVEVYELKIAVKEFWNLNKTMLN